MKASFLCIVVALITLAGCGGRQKNDSLAKNYLSQCMLETEQHNYKQAIQLANQSIKLCPTPHAYAIKATLLYQIKEFSESLVLFEKVISDKETPESLRSDAKNNYACLLNQQGQEQQAQAIWIALTTDPNYLTPEVAFLNLGLLALKKQQYYQAQGYFSQAVHLATDYVDALFYLALTSKKLGHVTQARQVLSELLAITDHPAARELLASLPAVTNEVTPSVIP